MKCSELIALLQLRLQEYGDLPVKAMDDCWGYEVEEAVYGATDNDLTLQ